jgi:hypothetical protein
MLYTSQMLHRRCSKRRKCYTSLKCHTPSTSLYEKPKREMKRFCAVFDGAFLVKTRPAPIGSWKALIGNRTTSFV